MKAFGAVRNGVCCALALGLIASGRVRRARMRALTSDTVTAIYFHAPRPRMFRRCVRWLISNGYRFISMDDLLRWLHCGAAIPRGAVWLSFDDGCREVLTDVLPLIQQHRIPVTLFIPSGIISGDGLLPWINAKPNPANASPIRHTLTVSELQKVASLPGVTIGSHTVNHSITVGLTPEQLRFELGESKRSLESWTKTIVNSFAYPVGYFDGCEKAVLREYGYVLAVTTVNALITREVDPYAVPRLSVADRITYPEAISNMVGIWRPFIDPVIDVVRRWIR